MKIQTIPSISVRKAGLIVPRDHIVKIEESEEKGLIPGHLPKGWKNYNDNDVKPIYSPWNRIKEPGKETVETGIPKNQHLLDYCSVKIS